MLMAKRLTREGEFFPWLTFVRAADFLQEGEEVRTGHCVNYFTFGGFFDFCACFFDSFLWHNNAPSRSCCYICHAYLCHGARC
jgi:hypothetical protein